MEYILILIAFALTLTLATNEQTKILKEELANEEK